MSEPFIELNLTPTIIKRFFLFGILRCENAPSHGSVCFIEYRSSPTEPFETYLVRQSLGTVTSMISSVARSHKKSLTNNLTSHNNKDTLSDTIRQFYLKKASEIRCSL